MLVVLFLLFILIAVGLGALGAWGTYVHRKHYWSGEIRMFIGWIGCGLNIVFALMSILSCVRFRLGTDIQTGYIYSVDEFLGEGEVHMRMSLEAGEDVQLPFCVNGEELEKARALAGTGKKVRVIIPETDLHFETNPFVCDYKVIIEEQQNEL